MIHPFRQKRAVASLNPLTILHPLLKNCQFQEVWSLTFGSTAQGESPQKKKLKGTLPKLHFSLSKSQSLKRPRGGKENLFLSLLITKRTHVASEKHSGKYAQKQAKKAPDPTPSSLWVGDDLWPPPLSFADAAEPLLSATSFVLLLELPFSVRGNILFGCLVLLSVLVRRSGVEFHSFESLLVGYIGDDD
ncbi:hypothetical protein TNCT_446251 [Trichonephila clavata]|uniref:Uncharacterized protein n=1 Tax=Trichonephila clavata TaxID=2740835 RepID=A0A8X6J8R9_TRICU|nr:hypothetical protein TNCT_446251 [Trichonephila clavata]